MTDISVTALESHLRNLNLDKTLDLIQFRTSFITNFDFDRVRELAMNQ